ncbi:MAG: ornithine carbamoyltransferase [Candidatus Woesearchaeota archaeon]
MKNLISLKNWNKREIIQLINLAIKIKKNPSLYNNTLKNKNLIMLFEKTSTRTRLSFEIGMNQLGGNTIFLNKNTTQMSIADYNDEMKVILNYCDILLYRPKKTENIINLSSFSNIPIINGCCQKYHPTQSLTDLMTMFEYSRGFKNIKKVVWIGIENNVSNTLKLLCSKLGLKLFILSPFTDPNSIDNEINDFVKKSSFIKITKNFKEALHNADFIHTDSWINMEYFENGKIIKKFSKEFEKRKKLLKSFQLNLDLIKKFAPNSKIMHCMPCHVNYEITREIIDSKNSIIFNQAKNRLFIHKAILLKLLGKV